MILNIKFVHRASVKHRLVINRWFQFRCGMTSVTDHWNVRITNKSQSKSGEKQSKTVKIRAKSGWKQPKWSENSRNRTEHVRVLVCMFSAKPSILPWKSFISSMKFINLSMQSTISDRVLSKCGYILGLLLFCGGICQHYCFYIHIYCLNCFNIGSIS